MSTYLVSRGPWNPDNASKLPGLTPTWSIYVNALTAATQSGPAIAAAETWSGGYQWLQDPNFCGIVSWGNTGGGSPITADPLYSFIPALNARTFALFDASGAPLPGQVAASAVSFLSVEDTATGLAPLVTPTITDIGGGCYRINNWTSTLVGTLYCPNANPTLRDELASPPGGTDTGALVVDVLTTLPLNPLEPLQLTVTDPTGAGRSAFLVIQYPPPVATWELVHDGVSFQPNFFAGSTFTVDATGVYSYTLNRAGGWPNQNFALVAYALSG